MENHREHTSSKIYKVIAGFFIISGVVVLYFWGFPKSEFDNPTTEPVSVESLTVAPEVNSLAPDFMLQNIKDETVQLRDFIGKPLLINFWATWCTPCRIEMPFIQDRFERFQENGLVVLAIDFDEPLEDVAYFGDELGLTFDLILDPGGKIQSLYRILGYPTSFFVDREGIIRVQHVGVMTEDQLDDYLAKIDIGN